MGWDHQNFLNLAFVGGRCVAKSLCKKCGTYKMLPRYDMQGHLAKDGFITTRNLTVYDSCGVKNVRESASVNIFYDVFIKEHHKFMTFLLKTS
jgi:hypothetical protein